MKFEKDVKNMASDKVIYFFSSSQRPLYKKDNINILCYPSGHIMHFRHDKKWIDTRIIENNFDNFKNKEAIIIIVDIEERDGEKIPLFFPIRKAKIKDIDFEGNVMHFYFELLPDWVNYRKNQELEDYQECIHSLRKRPSPGKKHLNGKFVSFEALLKNIKFSKEPDTWESIIKKIGDLESYKNTLFCKLSKFYEATSRKKVKIINFGDYKSGFALKSGKAYYLELSLKYGKRPPDNAAEERLIINVDEKFNKPIPDEIMLGFRVDKQNIYLSTKQLLSDYHTKLNINFREGFVEGPNVEIPIKIEYDRKHIWGSFLIFLIGLSLTSGLLQIKIIPQYLFKIFGSSISTFILYHLYREL